MNEIPSVDMREFTSEDPKRKSAFVNRIGGAFEDIGFVALRGHFLSEELVSELYGGNKAFFPIAAGSKAEV